MPRCLPFVSCSGKKVCWRCKALLQYSHALKSLGQISKMLCMLLSLELKVRRIHFCFKLVEINNINLKYFDAIVRNSIHLLDWKAGLANQRDASGSTPMTISQQ
jgi:hypothetical protein